MHGKYEFGSKDKLLIVCLIELRSNLLSYLYSKSLFCFSFAKIGCLMCWILSLKYKGF